MKQKILIIAVMVALVSLMVIPVSGALDYWSTYVRNPIPNGTDNLNPGDDWQFATYGLSPAHLGTSCGNTINASGYYFSGSSSQIEGFQGSYTGPSQYRIDPVPSYSPSCDGKKYMSSWFTDSSGGTWFLGARWNWNGNNGSVSTIVANFTANPSANWRTPQTVSFNSTSSGVPDSYHWEIGYPRQGLIYSADGRANIAYTFQNPSTYFVNLTVTNGTTTSTSSQQFIAVSSAGNITVYLNVRDALAPGNPLINGATLGIQNVTSGVWRNASITSGAASYSTTGANSEFPLAIGQTIKLAGSATGYSPDSISLTIPYNYFTQNLYLTQTSQTPTGGNWNLNVKVKRNRDAQPIQGATVEVITGVSGQGTYTGGTNDLGIASFVNISASTSALVNVIKQGYQAGSAIVTVFPNTTQTVNIELVAIGETPVATPVSPAPTSTYQTVGPTPIPTICDSAGCREVVTPDDNALFAFIRIIKMLPLWAEMVAGIVTFALMWAFLYWALGGKYRKRKGWH